MLKPSGMLGHTLVLLAGDAAGLTNPVTGAGIAAAVHSGRLAGEAAAAWAAGDRGAGDVYEEELDDVFRAALDRAVRRRRELLRRRRSPDKAALRRGWIAYPEYWTDMSCHRPEGASPADHAAAGLDHNPFALMQPRAPAATPQALKNGARVKANNVPPQGVYLPELQRADAAHALARVRADVDGGGDHARHHEGQDVPLRVHALPQPAAHLSRRLPRELRLLRPRAPPRGRARLRRPQLHPRRLAGGAARADRSTSWRATAPRARSTACASR